MRSVLHICICIILHCNNNNILQCDGAHAVRSPTAADSWVPRSRFTRRRPVLQPVRSDNITRYRYSTSIVTIRLIHGRRLIDASCSSTRERKRRGCHIVFANITRRIYYYNRYHNSSTEKKMSGIPAVRYRFFLFHRPARNVYDFNNTIRVCAQHSRAGHDDD